MPDNFTCQGESHLKDKTALLNNEILTLWVALCPDAPYFIILLCLMPKGGLTTKFL